MRKKVSIETVCAMACITILEIVALLKGIDGMMLSTSIGVIAGLGGFWLGRNQSSRKQTPEEEATE